MNSALYNLRNVQSLVEAQPGALKRPALVFVHGIFSSHETFKPLVRGLVRQNPALEDYGFYFFDYQYTRPIRSSGAELARVLRGAFGGGTNRDVTLIGHSMGGLVSRAAVLQADDLTMIKRLVMLGTPNHGTLQTARLGLLAHLIRESTATMWTVFARRHTGIKDLTEIGRVFDELVEQGRHRTREIDYVSIPGLRYSEESGWLQPEKSSLGLRLAVGAMTVATSLPGLRVELGLPHDGIVENRCVQLSHDPDHFSERPAVDSPYGPYLHLTHPAYKQVDHVHVQAADHTAELLAQLLSTDSLQTWRDQLVRDGSYNLFP